MGGHEAARVLTKTLVTATDRRYAEAAAAGLNGKEDAVPALAKALLETENPDRAWVLRNSSGATSPVRSLPAAISAMRSVSMSKPMTVAPVRANATATGRPT